MVEQELLIALKKEYKDKFKEVYIESVEGAYVFDTPLFMLHLGNDLDVNDGDYWNYYSLKNDLGLSSYFRCNRVLLDIYFLSSETIDRAKRCIEKFNLMDPKSVKLLIPYTIGSDFSIVSFIVA